MPTPGRVVRVNDPHPPHIPDVPQVPPPPPGTVDERLPRVSWTFLDAAGVFLLSFVLMALVSPLLTAALDEELAGGVFFPLSLAILAVTAVGWVAVRHRADLDTLAGRRPTPADVGMGIAHGLAGFLVINVGFAALLQLFTTLTGGEMPVVQEGLREATQDGRIGLFVIASAIIVAPVAEELFFRGVLFRGLLGPLGVWPAIGTSAVLFGLAHPQPTVSGTLYALAVLGTFGAYLAWAFERRGSLVTPMVMHATFNALAVGGILVVG